MANLIPIDPNCQRADAEFGESYTKRLIDGDSVSLTSRSSSIAAAPNDDILACEILSRLPAKPLMRFKCVSKGWKSIIEHDSNFNDLHNARSQSHPCLSISAIAGLELLLLSADLQQNRDVNGGVVNISSSIQSVKRIQLPSTVADPKYIQILGPTSRGMLCLFDLAGVSVQMCNVSTGEVTPWIQSPWFTDQNFKRVFGFERPKCYFGFDPSTGKHKAINVWSKWGFCTLMVCEVLTAGESSWRIIDDVPPCNNTNRLMVSGYANGSIYWLTAMPWVGNCQSLIAFDVGSEKFRMIRIPNSDWYSCTVRLIEMDGCPTVIDYLSSRDEVKMCKYEEEKDCWSEQVMTLPSDWFDGLTMEFHHVPGRDQMVILQSHVTDTRWLNVRFSGCYCYDVRSKSLSRFQIDGISSALLPDDCTTNCSAFVENLVPLLPRN